MKEVIERRAKGQNGPAWDLLVPAQQALIPRTKFLDCGDPDAAVEVKDVSVDETYDEEIVIPGTSVTVTSKAVTPRPVASAAVAQLPAVAALAGKVKLIATTAGALGAGLVSNNGSGIISDHASGIISDHAAGVISNSMIRKHLPYKDSDLVPVAMIGLAPSVILVPADAPYKDLKEFIAASKTGDGFHWATAGTGSTPHFVAGMLQTKYGAKLDVVP